MSPVLEMSSEVLLIAVSIGFGDTKASFESFWNEAGGNGIRLFSGSCDSLQHWLRRDERLLDGQLLSGVWRQPKSMR